MLYFAASRPISNERMEYFTLPELPDKPMFRCQRMSATLQVTNCSRMWSEANNAKPKPQCSTSPCKGCSIGAEHAGISDVSQSNLSGSPICARCHRVGSRMVGAHICVSCWNREREMLIGRNRRGVPPKFHPALYPGTIRFFVEGVVKTLSKPHVAQQLELIIACIRDNPKQVTFGLIRGMNGIR